jgi:hypothetical protein
MKIHLLYDRTSGEIVHTHISGDRALSKEDILHKATKERNKDNLDVLTVDSLPEGQAFKVDTASKALVGVDPKKIRGFSLGGVGGMQLARYPKGTKTTYKHTRKDDADTASK